jgi:hypothetical protein
METVMADDGLLQVEAYIAERGQPAVKVTDPETGEFFRVYRTDRGWTLMRPEVGHPLHFRTAPLAP